jgi:hypothetical protein
MRTKHRNDKNHGKQGFVGGNIKYRRHARSPRTQHGNQAMGRARQSRS